MPTRWKLLIVEDEIGIAHLIKNSIDFDKLPLELCGTAENGKKGLEMIRSLKPDIVITDIYMPVLNGVDMIQNAMKDGAETRFIIISGLTQFKYAMSALNAGVSGYLLKPLNKEELNILLEKTIQKIAQSRKIEYQLNVMESVLDGQRKERRNAYLFNLLHFRERVEEKDTEAVNESYGFSFCDDDSVYTIGVLLIDGLKHLNYSASRTIIEQLATEAYVHIQSVCTDMETYLRGNGFVFLCNYLKQDKLKFKGLLTNEFALIRQKLENYSDIAVCMSCGAPVETLSDIMGSLDSAIDTLQARVTEGTGKILDAEKLSALKPQRMYSMTETEATELISAVEIKELDKVHAVLDNIYKEAVAAASEYPCYLYDTLSEVTFDIASLLYRKNITGRLTSRANSIYRNSISQMSSADDLIKYSVSYIMEMLPDFDAEGSSESDMAANIRKYIDEHLSEQMRLEDVASAFYLSPSYFGTVFKNEIGESFSAYLQSARINHAKELLVESNDTIDMIAGKCGYLDRKHFSKLFANVVGVKPNEYRKLNR